MALDNRYVTGFSLEQVFRDKDTGEPLAGGIISFFEDENRIVPKNVFELVGAPTNPPPNYVYAPLPNPIILSSIGTIQDAAGNNVALYAYPYDAAGNLELYYVTVTNQYGVPQFTREAWPSSLANGNANAGQANIANLLTNPQFAQVLFIPGAPLVINIAGAGTQRIAIAPDWFITVTTTGASTVTLTRTSITGVTAYPFNPPYTLTITPGANITVLQLSQRLNNNPSIFSPQNAGSLNGWVAASILLAPLSSLQMIYAPSQGPQQVLLNANNLTGVYTEFSNTVQLTPANSTDNSNVGYVDIILSLPAANPTTISNVQITGLQSNIQNVTYDQTPVNRQVDFMFNYYNSLLQYKPISSYLIGWDFAKNPAQALGTAIAASGAGANTSRYVWDQTIVFQSANNGPAISRGTNGALTITATNATQFAVIQYLEAVDARELLNSRNSVNVAAISNNAGGLNATISLWYTTDANLPSCAANNSIVATLTAAGKPATFNGNWVEIPRSNLGDAVFTIGASPTTTNFNDYGFSGWDLQGIAATNTATFFAIVVGTATLGAASTASFQSISLVPGDIPTRPAPKTTSDTILSCQRYYYKSFQQGTVPAQAVGVGTGDYAFLTYVAGAGPTVIGTYEFPVPMSGVPAITFFNPSAANAFVWDISSGASWSVTTTTFVSATTWNLHGTTDAGSLGTGSLNSIHFTADARLGR